MQASVPQYIDVEDKIIGPLTLKQFLYFLAAGAVEMIYWFFFDFSLFILVTIPTLAVAVAFVFVRINDRPFIYFVLAFLGFYLKPMIRVWQRKSDRFDPREMIYISFQEEAQSRDLVKAHMKRGSLSNIEKALETA